ncbi:alanine--tRNA ligase [mine drainage metagenome]|uniref:Alanine--tRNA ligase n=1 Tax=mine drainage metagenome TaxID=410659 RepID=A0A1J5PIX5_9ZZZZ
MANPSLKVIADHIRATAFLVSDGVLPNNEGRGYVQRRIIRRAIRHGYKLGQKTPFFHKLVPDLVAVMGAAYPNLAAQADRIMDVLRVEEERFFETLEIGMQILDEALHGDVKVLPGDIAFKLHDTYGFPLDLSADVCRERGVSVNEAGFHAAMEKQKSQGRAAGKFKMDKALEYTGVGNEFIGYEQLTTTTEIVAIYADGISVASLKEGQSGVLVLATTPFYGESGGQVGDAGAVFCDHALFEVADTQKIKADVFGHHADELMISSTKSMHGHVIGGTGAVELLACIMALRDGVIAPTIGYEEPDPECALDVVPNVARDAKVAVVLSNAFAFGGLNAVIALRAI